MEALIFLANNVHADPVKDRRGCWKRGMVVDVCEDGGPISQNRETSKQYWIREGSHRPRVTVNGITVDGAPIIHTANNWPQQGRSAILKVPGVPVAKVRALLDAQEGVDDAGAPYAETVTVDRGNGPELVVISQRFRLREWRLVFDSLPNSVRTTVSRDGEFTTTVSAIRNFLKRIRDDAQFTGLD